MITAPVSLSFLLMGAFISSNAMYMDERDHGDP